MARVRSLQEWQEHKAKDAETRRSVDAWLDDLAKTQPEVFSVRGYSYPAHAFVDFRVDREYALPGAVNWRERVVCPITHLNNRMRAAFHVLGDLAPEKAWQRSYITEQVTPLFALLSARFKNIIGSEYLGEDVPPGHVNEDGVRHEDMCNLSFADNSLDIVISFDCLEHVPDYESAFSEAFRVLSPGGYFIWSAPFITENQENQIRARIEDGTIVHMLEPQYHGDPMSQDGILCFQEFGWQSFEQLRALGFSDVYALFIRSEHFGYLGDDQMFVVAKK